MVPSHQTSQLLHRLAQDRKASPGIVGIGGQEVNISLLYQLPSELIHLIYSGLANIKAANEGLYWRS